MTPTVASSGMAGVSTGATASSVLAIPAAANRARIAGRGVNQFLGRQRCNARLRPAALAVARRAGQEAVLRAACEGFEGCGFGVAKRQPAVPFGVASRGVGGQLPRRDWQ